MGLKAAGKKVFQIMYGQLLGRDGKDRTEIPLKYELLSPDVKEWISNATFRRGVKELVEAHFIAESMLSGYFFVNPAFIFNGNRLLIAHAYTLKPEKPEKQDKKALKAAKQKALEEDQIPLPFDD